MSLIKWAFIGLLVLPAAEVAAFILVAQIIGWTGAFALFVGTSVIGILLLRQSGRAHLAQLRAAVASGGLRAVNLNTPGFGRLIGGILLVFPGFITDIVGALLLVPFVRQRAGETLAEVRKERQARRDPSVIDLAPGEWTQISERKVDHGSGRDRRSNQG